MLQCVEGRGVSPLRPATATAGSHTRWRQFASRIGSPLGLLKSTSSGFLPVAWATKASISDRGMGTSRDWCVFGIDQIMCPLTSDTDSDTRSRRRIRSTERTRSRGTLAEPQPAQAEHQDHQPVRARAIRQVMELGHGEETLAMIRKRE
jgi:hypothetical protein